MEIVKTVLEIAFGVLFLIGAIFNTFYTLRHGDVFYGGFADNAMIPIVRKFFRNIVIPHSKFFTIPFIAFELFVAFAILSRGSLVQVGLIAGSAFAFVAVFLSSVGGAIANLIMAIVLLLLAIL